MKDNLAFIHEKTEELERLQDEIQEKMKENDRKKRDLEKKNKELNMKVVKMRDESSDLKNDFKRAWESMFHFRANFEKLSTIFEIFAFLYGYTVPNCTDV